MAILSPPADTTVFETRSSLVWQDEYGIVYSVTRPEAPLLTNEDLKADMQLFREHFGNEKLPLILEASQNRPLPPNEQRTLIQQELNATVKAMAIITSSTLSKMTANIFFVLKPPAYPVKMFTDVGEAKKWIMRVCHISNGKNNAA
jgi:hypothetical protein